MEGIHVSPKGWVTVDLPGGPVRLRLGFSEMADADEFLKRGIVGAMSSDPLNFHNLRVAFYFASRELNKGIRSVKGAGKLLDGANLELVSEALFTAMRESGVMSGKDEEAEEAEEEIEGEA